MANIITSCRILCSTILLLFPTFSPAFYVFYISAGVTDMIDGAIARRTGTASEFGAKLDSIADTTFVVSSLIKILPVIQIPRWICIWIGAIAVIKIINILSGFVMQKTFVAEHTVMNKVTGLLLFAIPLTVSFVKIKYSGILVALVATFAAVQEGHFIRIGRIDE